ncbi:hypothetical protein VO64_4218 [Pseudomonas synxantha]|uniref:Uncharacterized protein n=1 Tax=Pseudomonas synxantha TaxID=47883 RepID=A0AAU8TSQ5_9PSED|nr:hypothetical protein VO64_4218 [Pseudomonas synxantha]
MGQWVADWHKGTTSSCYWISHRASGVSADGLIHRLGPGLPRGQTRLTVKTGQVSGACSIKSYGQGFSLNKQQNLAISPVKTAFDGCSCKRLNRPSRRKTAGIIT